MRQFIDCAANLFEGISISYAMRAVEYNIDRQEMSYSTVESALTAKPSKSSSSNVFWQIC